MVFGSDPSNYPLYCNCFEGVSFSVLRRRNETDAACGAGLRAWIEGLPGPARRAWAVVYDQFRAGFHGVEYE